MDDMSRTLAGYDAGIYFVKPAGETRMVELEKLEERGYKMIFYKTDDVYIIMIKKRWGMIKKRGVDGNQ